MAGLLLGGAGDLVGRAELDDLGVGGELDLGPEADGALHRIGYVGGDLGEVGLALVADAQLEHLDLALRADDLEEAGGGLRHILYRRPDIARQHALAGDQDLVAGAADRPDAGVGAAAGTGI